MSVFPTVEAESRELLPCPFCGAAPEKHPQRTTDPRLVVWCEACGADGPEALTGEEAITAWNRRAAPSPATGVSPTRKEIEDAIAEADQRLAYSMDLVKLVDGDHTYRLKIDGVILTFQDSETPEWNAQQRLYEHVAECKNRIRSDAILALFNGAGR